MTSDTELLRRYVTDHSEGAFAELVHQRLGLVYGVALRRTRNPHLAEEACQRVFTALARKAPSLIGRPVLAGWLYRGAQLAAAEVLRNEARRARREQDAITMAAQEAAAMNPDWDKVRPLLDEAVAQLPAGDRDALLLRFADGQPYAEVGARLGASENAARMRVNRALEKLRSALGGRGVDSSLAALTLALATDASAAIPAGLAAQIGAGACAAAAGTGLGAAGLIAFMSSTKVAAILGLAALVAGGTALYEAQAAKTSAVALAAMTVERDGLRASLQAAARRAAAVSAALAPRIERMPSGPMGARLAAVRTAVDAAAQNAAVDPQRLARYHQRYDGFVKERGLTPEQAAQFYSILIGWGTMADDFQAAIREQGLTATPEAQALRNQLQLQNEVQPFRELLGEDGARAYSDYEQSSYYRAIADQPARALAGASVPLTGDQQAQLAAAIRANSHNDRRDPSAMGADTVIDWAAVAAGSAAYLSLPQKAALEAYAARAGR